jgi:hypothetical protein
MRDAWNWATVATTSSEVHDRSEVLTGASYRLFFRIYADLLREGDTPLVALQEAGRMMGILTLRVCDFVPETAGTMADVARGYLKADKELFGGHYRHFLVSELLRRGLIDDEGLAEWSAHEAALPRLWLQPGASRSKVGGFVATHLDALGIADPFDLKVQEVVRERVFGHTVVRVQLIDGSGHKPVALGNFGILVFRADGWLAEYHPPVGAVASVRRLGSLSLAAQAAAASDALRTARAFGLEKEGGLLTFVRRDDGTLEVETHVPGGAHMESWVDVFSVEHPEGRRVDVRQF